MARKLSKVIEGTVVTISVLGMDEDMVFDSNDLPKEIQNRLIPFAVGHKLGDSAAAAKTPEDAQKNINRVWNNLLAGEWKTAREPGEATSKTSRITQKTILANLEKLPMEQKKAAKELLVAMGFSLS